MPMRVHSECLTGDVLGSLRCDCRDQLEAALRLLGEMERGVLLYLRQEGRGIGLINKIRAYSLQDLGFDTVEANLALGFRDEERDFAVAAHMIRSLRIRSIALMTNNPYKITELEKHGVRIASRLPHQLPPNPHNRFYLETKTDQDGSLPRRGRGGRGRLDQAARRRAGREAGGRRHALAREPSFGPRRARRTDRPLPASAGEPAPTYLKPTSAS